MEFLYQEFLELVRPFEVLHHVDRVKHRSLADLGDELEVLEGILGVFIRVAGKDALLFFVFL